MMQTYNVTRLETVSDEDTSSMKQVTDKVKAERVLFDENRNLRFEVSVGTSAEPVAVYADGEWLRFALSDEDLQTLVQKQS